MRADKIFQTDVATVQKVVVVWQSLSHQMPQDKKIIAQISELRIGIYSCNEQDKHEEMNNVFVLIGDLIISCLP